MSESFKLELIIRNQPGVLVRCAQILSRRGYNISSLQVAEQSDNCEQSKLVIVTQGDAAGIRQIKAQLYKLIDVASIN
jgi:acetolactate synthase I/III small subunit